MELATRVVSIERGYDPRRLALAAFGGSGPVHGCRLAAGARHPAGDPAGRGRRHLGDRPARRRGAVRPLALVRDAARRARPRVPRAHPRGDGRERDRGRPRGGRRRVPVGRAHRRPALRRPGIRAVRPAARRAGRRGIGRGPPRARSTASTRTATATPTRRPASSWSRSRVTVTGPDPRCGCRHRRAPATPPRPGSRPPGLLPRVSRLRPLPDLRPGAAAGGARSPGRPSSRSPSRPRCCPRGRPPRWTAGPT